MNVKHTPAPWVIIPARAYDGEDDSLDGLFVCPASIEGSDGNPVCQFGSEAGSGTLFENEADYHLIAAAPELLEAALKALNFIENTESEMGEALSSGDSLRAAIAKAGGAS